MNSLTVTIPWPPKQKHPNSRAHWRSQMAAKKTQRGSAVLAVLEALDGRAKPMWKRASVRPVFHLPYRGQRHDPDNLIAWLKASIDGLRDAGLIADDNAVRYEEPLQVRDGKPNPANRGWVELIVTQIEEPASALRGAKAGELP